MKFKCRTITVNGIEYKYSIKNVGYRLTIYEDRKVIYKEDLYNFLQISEELIKTIIKENTIQCDLYFPETN